MKKLIVRNKRVVSDYFNIELEDKEDLFNRLEKKIKSFIKTYDVFLFSKPYDKLKELTKKTGLIILRVYHVQNSYNEFYLDELGMTAKWENDYGIPSDRYHIFKHHLTVHIYLDKIINEKKSIYGLINNQKFLIYKPKYNKNNNLNKQLFFLKDDFKRNDSYKLSSKQNLIQIKESEIKQIVLVYPFDDFLLLKNNGDLFVNGKLYAKGVRKLNCLTTYRTYIIFENESVELYTSTFIQSASSVYKNIKTLTVNKSFVAFFTDSKDLFISTVASDNCEIDFDFDNCIDFYLSCIDDVDYTYDVDNQVATLNIMSGDRKIFFPLYINIRR